MNQKRIHLTIGAAAALGLFAVFASTLQAKESTVTEEESAKHFVEMAKVLSSPRCRNCHPTGDTPLHGDTGVPHSMNVVRTSADVGLQCTTCHRSENQPDEHSPPGVPGWRMPDAKTPMTFQGLSVSDLCTRLKDTKLNGGRSPDDLREHMEHDALILWAWKPGPGRSVPPLTHEVFMDHVRGWVKGGAACPKSE